MEGLVRRRDTDLPEICAGAPPAAASSAIARLDGKLLDHSNFSLSGRNIRKLVRKLVFVVVLASLMIPVQMVLVPFSK